MCETRVSFFSHIIIFNFLSPRFLMGTGGKTHLSKMARRLKRDFLSKSLDVAGGIQSIEEIDLAMATS